MSSRINSGQKALQRLVGSRIISPSGADWAVAAADPFHDLELENLCGYPDTQVGQSVVLKVPYEMTISAPNTTDIWQFMLVTYPWTCGDQGTGPIATDYDLFGNCLRNVAGATNSVNRMPPVCIYAGKQGNNLGPFNLGLAGNVGPQGLGLNDSYAKGSHRVIGWGVEVYDTTAVISRQGTCTVFRQNTNTYNKANYLYQDNAGAPKFIGCTAGVAFNRPPQNIAEANLLAGTRSWKSEDGCYLVMTQNQEQLLAKQPDDTQPIIFSGDISPGIRGPVPARVITGSTLSIPTGDTYVSVPQVVWNLQPYHMSGCFFSGLSPQSTFLIRTVFYVERFPTPDEEDIVLLTKPSACHDPVALEIYDRMLKEMPVGVPVAENGLGEWFYDAIKAIVPAISMIPHPLAKAAGGIGTAILSGMDANSTTAASQTQRRLPQPRGPPKKPLGQQSAPKRQPQPKKQPRPVGVAANPPRKRKTKT